MSDKSPKSPTVPYVSWKTFVNYLQSLQQSIPNRIDTSGMLTLSGSNRNLIMATLKFFGLIDESGKPQQAVLEPLVNSYTTATMSEFQKLLRQLLEKHYPPLFVQGFDLKTATPAHFGEEFGKLEISGDTRRKAETFFLEAAKAAGVPISSTIVATRGKGRRGSTGTTRRQAPPPHREPPPTDNGNSSGSGTGVQGELPAWYVTFKPAFDLLPKFSINPKPKWTNNEKENFLNLVTAITTAYTDVEDRKKA